MTSSAVIYCRISRDREGQGLGVERQEQDCRALAGRLGLSVARVFVDNDVSAYSGRKRPQFEEMMRQVEGGQVAVILAYSNSRLTRRPLELERLIAMHAQTGVRLHTVAAGEDDLSTADGRMVARIKASVDRAESDRISDRVRRQQQQAREAGKWHGGWRPYGYEDDGVTVRESEAAVIEQTARRLIGGQSLAALVADLNQRGVPTSRGGRWSSRTLRRVLLRQGSAPELASAVRALLDDPARRTTPGPVRRWLLSGLASCGVCGGPLVGSASSLGKGRGTYPAYRCKTGKHTVISATTLDEYVSFLAVEALSAPDAHGVFAGAGRQAEAAELAGQAQELRTRLDTLADDLSVDERTMARRSAALRKALDDVERRYATLAGESPLEGLGEDPAAAWGRLSLARRRAVVGILFASITVVAGRRGVVPKERRWRADLPAFDPERVLVEWK